MTAYRIEPTATQRRFLPLIGFGLLTIAAAGLTFAGRTALLRADDKPADKKTVDEDVDEVVRKALEALKNGPPPKAVEEKKPDLNPIDELRQSQDALKKAREELDKDPKSDEARKALEDAQKRVQEAGKNQPNFRPLAPFAPINPADLGNVDLEALFKELEKAQADLLRQMQNMPFQPGGFQGNRIVIINGRPVLNGGFGQAGGTRLGVRVERLTPALVEQLELPENQGILVSDVIPNTPAEKAGIKANDVLLSIGGKDIPNDNRELVVLLREIKADEKVDIVIMRKGKKETIKEVALPAIQPINQFQGVPRLQFPNLNPAFPPQGLQGGGKSTSMSVSVVNGEYVMKFSEDDIKIVLKGTKEDGQLKPNFIEIDDNGKTFKTDTLEKVEEPYKEMVDKMLKRVR